MKFKIEQFNKTFTVKVKSVSSVMKSLRKANVNPTISYEYWATHGVLCVNIDIAFGLEHTYTLHYPVKWDRDGKPYVDTMSPETEIIVNTLCGTYNDKIIDAPHTHALYMFDGCTALECYCTGTKDYCEHLLNNDPWYQGCTLVELTHPWKRSED